MIRGDYLQIGVKEFGYMIELHTYIPIETMLCMNLFFDNRGLVLFWTIEDIHEEMDAIIGLNSNICGFRRG